jgi:spermidine synthase
MASLVQLAQEASTSVGFERAVLDLFQRVVGFDVGFFSVKGAEESPTVEGLGADLVERAIQGGPRYYEELLPVKRAALRKRGVAVDTSVLGQAGVEKAAYYRDVARRVGGRHSLMAYVPLRGRIVAGMMLGRCGSAFSDEQLARVEELLPELGVARASFGLPGVSEPLHTAAPPGFWERLAGARAPDVLAVERIGALTVEVRDRAGFREMVAREASGELVWTRARLRDPRESGWPYVELLHLAALQARGRSRALFVGCGGAVALRQFASTYPGLAIDLVEREPRVVELARRWFELDQIPGVSVHIADGAPFIERAAPSSRDIAVIDAFDGADAVESARRSLLRALERALVPGGALAINLIGTLERQGLVHRTARELSKAFARVRVVPVMEATEEYSPNALRNVVLVASKRERA